MSDFDAFIVCTVSALSHRPEATTQLNMDSVTSLAPTLPWRSISLATRGYVGSGTMFKIDICL